VQLVSTAPVAGESENVELEESAVTLPAPQPAAASRTPVRRDAARRAGHRLASRAQLWDALRGERTEEAAGFRNSGKT
jgi:hypothetical protein